MGCKLGDPACKPGLRPWFPGQGQKRPPLSMENKDFQHGGRDEAPTTLAGLLPFVCILGFHTCVGKSRTRGRPDTRRDRKEISEPRESSRPGSLLCVAQTTPGRARGRWAGQRRGRIQCACGGGGGRRRPGPYACTRVRWGVPSRTQGLSVQKAPRELWPRGALGSVGVRAWPGATWLHC